MRSDGSEVGTRSAHAQELRAGGRRETAMAETPPGPGGSPGPAAPPSPGGSAGPREDERCPGGGSPESGGTAPDPDFPKPPASKKRTPGSSGKKKRAASSPGEDQAVNYRHKRMDQAGNCGDLSPIVTSPEGKRPGRAQAGNCGDLSPIVTSPEGKRPGRAQAGNCGDLSPIVTSPEGRRPGRAQAGNCGDLSPIVTSPEGRRPGRAQAGNCGDLSPIVTSPEGRRPGRAQAGNCGDLSPIVTSPEGRRPGRAQAGNCRDLSPIVTSPEGRRPGRAQAGNCGDLSPIVTSPEGKRPGRAQAGNCGDLSPIVTSPEGRRPGRAQAGNCGDLSPIVTSPEGKRPGRAQAGNCGDLSPIVTSPEGKRRSWCRSSLQGRRSRRKSLPPVHREVTELSQSISLELPEIQRLSALLLSSFQFSARKLQQILEENEGFDAQIFGAKVRSGSEDLQRLLQRLLQDGTLGNCVELPPGDSLDPALGGAVAQVKETMARLSAELQAWAELLQQQQHRSSEANRNLELLKSGSSPQAPPGSPKNPQILQILSSKPNYEEILRENRDIPRALSITVDEVRQAGKLLLEFSEESERFLRDLSEELAHRTFRKLPPSPARKLLQTKPQRESKK